MIIPVLFSSSNCCQKQITLVTFLKTLRTNMRSVSNEVSSVDMMSCDNISYSHEYRLLEFSLQIDPVRENGTSILLFIEMLRYSISFEYKCTCGILPEWVYLGRTPADDTGGLAKIGMFIGCQEDVACCLARMDS